MNDYSVELSSSAQSQIVKIRDYIRYELNNPSAAEKFLDDTEEAIDSLSQFPYAHMVRRGQNYILEMKKDSISIVITTVCSMW